MDGQLQPDLQPEEDDDSDTICFVDFDTGRVSFPDAPYAPRNAPEPPMVQEIPEVTPS